MISVTDLIKWLFCPHSFYAERILKVKMPSTAEMIRGTVVHKIEESIIRKNEGIMMLLDPRMSEKEISELLFDNWKRIIKREVLKKRKDLEKAGMDHIDFIKELKHSFRNEAIIKGIRLKEDFKVARVPFYEVIVEEKMEDEELGLRGIVDRIEVIEGHHIPVEIKSGVPRVDEFHKLQLSAYVMLCERRFLEKIPLGFLFFTLWREKTPVFVTEAMKEDVIKAKEEVERILDGFIPQRIRGIKCEGCKYFNYCFSDIDFQ